MLLIKSIILLLIVILSLMFYSSIHLNNDINDKLKQEHDKLKNIHQHQ